MGLKGSGPFFQRDIMDNNELAGITKLPDQVNKMRGESVNLRIKLEDFRGQRSSLRVTGWPWRTARR